MVIFPDEHILRVSSILYLAGTSVFAAFLASWTLRVRSAALPLASAFLSLTLLWQIIGIVVQFSTARDGPERGYSVIIMSILGLAVVSLMIWKGFARSRSRLRRASAILLVLTANVGAGALLGMDSAFWQLSAELRPIFFDEQSDATGEDDDNPPAIEADRLWEAQTALVEQEQASIEPRISGRPNVYGLAIAGSGAQALFSREAHKALSTMSAHFGGDYRGGILLSNGAADLMNTPLATRGNIGALTKAIAKYARSSDDLVVIYLTSHGSRDAELTSDLPDYQSIQPISSASLSEALKQAKIEKRVIIVSACYSGSWIPALANEDTIVIAAAAKDRVSFGCDDSRQLTYFGEAFLQGPLVEGASFHEAFESAKKKIAQWEADQKLTGSLPQAFVGRNMKAFWIQKGAAKPR
jgi:hypothetical protein